VLTVGVGGTSNHSQLISVRSAENKNPDIKRAHAGHVRGDEAERLPMAPSYPTPRPFLVPPPAGTGPCCCRQARTWRDTDERHLSPFCRPSKLPAEVEAGHGCQMTVWWGRRGSLVRPVHEAGPRRGSGGGGGREAWAIMLRQVDGVQQRSIAASSARPRLSGGGSGGSCGDAGSGRRPTVVQQLRWWIGTPRAWGGMKHVPVTGSRLVQSGV
jgi:hypothetical protein